MPANFPEVWEKKVRELITKEQDSTFLDGIPELESEIQTDDLGENNIIHVSLETFDPTVLINNTTYPLTIEDHADGSKSITLDKFQSLPTKVKEDDIIGASYDKIDSVTKRHRKKITTVAKRKAAHAIAPAANTTDTPIITLPGSYTSNDVYLALVALKGKFDDFEAPEEGRRVVLCSNHYNKLLEDRALFGDILVDHATGKVNKLIAGFEIYTYISNPYYTAAGAKVAFGAVPGGTDKRGSFAFVVDNIGKKTGLTRQYYDKPTTTTQAHLLNYRHYFIALPLRNKYIGAILG